MNAILSFELPEDRGEFEIATRSMDWAFSCVGFRPEIERDCKVWGKVRRRDNQSKRC